MRLETIDANASWLRSAGSDPIRYLDPQPVGEAADRERLQIADRCFRRGETIWAAASARRALEGPLGAEATEMMRRLGAQTH